jgi:hypothetical protein
MLPLPVEEQDRRLRAECPQFRLVAHAGWIGVWEGTVRPVCQTYRIRIVYFSRRYFPGWDLDNPYLSVFVVDPPIGPDPRGTGEKPQHVYSYRRPPAFPALCVFDPKDDNWQPSEYIVDRIIPWTIKWLFFHEEWVASGVWKGGGRHPELPEPCLTQHDLDPESRARRERFRNAAFHRLGRKIGVFASCPLMEAVSGGCFPPPPWPRWNGLTPADIRWQISSILSPGPRRAAYSPSAWERDFLPRSFSTSTSRADAKSSLLSPTTALAA